MKTPDLIIRIPEPCHEDWSKMNPNDKGRHCFSCNKTVIDFTNKSNAEVTDILKIKSDKKLCGRFYKSQLNNPLNSNYLPKNLSFTKAFAIALFLAFGTFLFSCTNYENKKVSEEEIQKTKEEQYEVLLGLIVSPEYNLESQEGESTFFCDTAQSVEQGKNNDYSTESITALQNTPDSVEPQMLIFNDTVVMGGIGDYYDYTHEPECLTIEEDSILNSKVINRLNSELPEDDDELLLFPNPAQTEVNIKYTVQKPVDVFLDLYDLSGNLIKPISSVTNQHTGNYNIAVNISEIPNGIYLVSLIKANKRFNEKIIIQH